MAASLARAVEAAVDLLPSNAAQADCVIACNSAHFFWELLKSEVTSIPRLEQRLNLVSTVECAIRALRDLTRGPVLLLCTQGARVGCIFSSAAAKANIPFIELGPDLECVLMRLIYEGPKSLNESKTVALGTYFFETVEKRMANIDCILAGCTELPAVVELLREQGTPAVRSFLSRVAIVDPMNAVLDAVACHAGG